jgi:plastocyanin
MLAGISAAASAMADGKTVEVSMTNQPAAAFEPSRVKIGVGDTVRWTNPELITHTVTFDPTEVGLLPDGVKPFSSPDLEQDQTFKYTFTVKGVYKYFCKYHVKMGMVGTVEVL